MNFVERDMQKAYYDPGVVGPETAFNQGYFPPSQTNGYAFDTQMGYGGLSHPQPGMAPDMYPQAQDGGSCLMQGPMGPTHPGPNMYYNPMELGQGYGDTASMQAMRALPPGSGPPQGGVAGMGRGSGSSPPPNSLKGLTPSEIYPWMRESRQNTKPRPVPMVTPGTYRQSLCLCIFLSN